jgi:hypothetical protein
MEFDVRQKTSGDYGVRIVVIHFKVRRSINRLQDSLKLLMRYILLII